MADICQFSRLVQAQEIQTIDELTKLRDDIVIPRVAAHNGAIANRAGDGVLAIFETVKGAVDCAEEIIEETIARYPDFRWRIGIHLADVVYEDETVHGHGVNLASRIEAFAEPNSVVVTRTVVEALGERPDRKFRKIGRKKLKNISPPISLYALGPHIGLAKMLQGGRFALGFIAVLLMIGIAAVLGQRTGSLSEIAISPVKLADPVSMPSVAILPFKSLSPESSDPGFETAIASEIITDLTRFTGIKVFALSTMERLKERSLDDIYNDVGAQYVVSGTVQSGDDGIRIGVELAEAATSRVLWAKRFQAPVEEAFEIQLEIAKSVAAVVGPVGKGAGLLGPREWQRAANTKPTDMDAYGYLMVGRSAESRSDLLAAQAAYSKALGLDPNFGRASARLAWTHAYPYWTGQSGPLALPLARAASDYAMAKSPQDNEVRRIHGAIMLLSGQFDAGIAALKEAVELNPGDADTLMWFGWGLTYIGRVEEALTHMKAANDLNPYPPAWYDWYLAWAHFMAAQPTETVRILSPKTRNTPNDYFLLAASQARLGLIEEMEATSTEFRRHFPELGWGTMVEAQPFMYPNDRLNFEDALKLTSIPKAHPEVPN